MAGRERRIMMKKKIWGLALASAVIVLMVALGGCSLSSGQNKLDANLKASNEIVSYKSVDTSKTVITFGKIMALDAAPLEKAIEAKFPDVDIVPTDDAAGTEQGAYLKVLGDNDALPDITFATVTLPANDFMYDQSAESYISRYNLSALNAVSLDGKIYQVPIENSVNGIAYNKTLFAEHGWSVPNNLDEFYSLCDQISAAGIRPFVPCMKYYSTIESVAMGLSYDDVFADANKQVAYNKFSKKEGSCKGVLEPSLTVLKNLYDKGIITDDDFSSSVTSNRQDLYAGKIAMMPVNSDIFSFVREENPDAEIGFIGYPTRTDGARWMQMCTGNKLSISKKAMADSKKKAIIEEIMDYLSTDEGQAVMFESFSGVSSLSSYQDNISSDYGEVKSTMEAGHIFYANFFASNDFNPTFKKFITGQMSMDDMITACDAVDTFNAFKKLDDAAIGKASKDFTVLETSMYNADVLKEASGAEIALLPNMSYYQGNLAQIFKGDIKLPERFVLKGVGSKDYLTTYQITGANLKKLMEHPVIKGSEVNIMYAFSGLKMEYAPWKDKDQNVVSLTLADGTAIDDNKTYNVAAWAGGIDKQYISGTVKAFSDAGDNKTLMTAAIKKAGTISPVDDGRIKLDY